MILIPKSLKAVLFLCTLFFLVQGISAFTVGAVTVNPSTDLYPGNPVNVSCTVYAAAGTAFSSYDDLQFITELDDPAWIYTISVNGVKNTRPVTGGRILTISGYELAYRNQDEVIVTVVLQARIPVTAALGLNKTLVRVQEIDARGYAIPYSIVNIENLIGKPTPTPTPAYGRIEVTTSPAGADIYIDNVYKGLSPAVFDAIPNGKHVVLVKLDGYQEVAERVTVSGDYQAVQTVLYQQTTVTPGTPSVTLTPATNTVSLVPTTSAQTPGYGSLSIVTTPEGALVYVDGAMKGVTPTTIPMMTEGSHSIVLVMDGYNDLKTSIIINAGTTSEYITGLSKTTKTPGFVAGITAISIGVLLLFRKIRG
jgi:hypothetical protein